MPVRIGIALGDRNGIGPEIVARLLGDPAYARQAAFTLVCDPQVLAYGERVAGVRHHESVRVVAFDGPQGEAIGAGAVSAAAGAEALAHLATLTSLARAGEIDAIVFGPLNKQALRAGGLGRGDELDYFMERFGTATVCGELNLLDGMWTSRVTSHIPLKDVASAITGRAIAEAIDLLHDAIHASGVAAPRLGVAGLNPHAGDGGTFGDEEIVRISPAIEAARARGRDVVGPLPADTMFVTARETKLDGIITMYHDQGQIALKLLGFGRGVTVLAGLPVPVVTVGHGTAYDIAGRGLARSDGVREATRVAVEMARHLSAAPT